MTIYGLTAVIFARINMRLLDDYKVLTITHHNINVDELGYFVIKQNSDEELQHKLDELKSAMQIEELIYLATCNRVSYIFTAATELSTEFVQQFFTAVNPDLKKETSTKIEKFVSTYEGLQAVNHVMEVASSMDSLVVGEREIFRQLRQAYSRSLEFGHVKDNLRLLDRFVVTAAKEVYEKTKIGEKPLSIVSLAVQALYACDVHEDSRILMVGAGETNTKVAKFLKKKHFRNVAVFNRSIDNAAHLSQLLSAEAYHLQDLQTYDRGFDVIIVCTGATDPVITLPIYRQLLQRDTARKVVIDLSVPANVAHEVVNSFDINYIDIEKLRVSAETNLQHRRNELTAARQLLRAKLVEFQKAHQQRQLEMLLHLVPKEIKAVKQHAVDNVYAKKLEMLDDSSKALVMEMMDYMEKKCISVPMKAAKTLI